MKKALINGTLTIAVAASGLIAGGLIVFYLRRVVLSGAGILFDLLAK